MVFDRRPAGLGHRFLPDGQVPQNIGIIPDQKTGAVSRDILELECIDRQPADPDGSPADLMVRIWLFHSFCPFRLAM